MFAEVQGHVLLDDVSSGLEHVVSSWNVVSVAG
jgi:hypothetical protein